MHVLEILFVDFAGLTCRDSRCTTGCVEQIREDSQQENAHSSPMSDFRQPTGQPQHHTSHIDGPKIEIGVPSPAPIRRVIRKRPREGVDILREVDAGVT